MVLSAIQKAEVIERSNKGEDIHFLAQEYKSSVPTIEKYVEADLIVKTRQRVKKILKYQIQLEAKLNDLKQIK
jgi:hypothetical protein